MDYERTYITSVQEKQILKQIMEHLGFCSKDLASLLQMTSDVFSHAIVKLKNSNIIYYIKEGSKKFYYVNENFIKDNPNFLETLETKYEREQKKKQAQLEYDTSYVPSIQEKQVLKKIIEHSGFCVKELAASLRFSSVDVSRKASKLKKHNIIYGLKDGTNRFYYVNENFIKDNPNFLETLETKYEREQKKKQKQLEYDKTYVPTKKENQIIKEMIQHPGFCVIELANSLQMSANTFSRATVNLKKYNIIYGLKDGKNRFYYVNENFIKDNPNFLETLEIEYKREQTQLEYDKTYVPTKKENQIIKEMIQHPGFCVKELANSLQMSANAFSCATVNLKKHNIIYGLKDGTNRFYYVNENFIKDNPNFLETLEIEYKRKQTQLEYDKTYVPTKKENQIIKEMIQHPGFCVKELANSLQMSANTFSRVTVNLKKHNIIYGLKDGTNRFYYVNEKFMEENFNIFNTKEVKARPLTDSLILLSIKNILFYSKSTFSKILLDNFEFFLSCFSFMEFLQLLYFLNIYQFEEGHILKIADKELETKIKRDILMRFQEACTYLSVLNKEKGI